MPPGRPFRLVVLGTNRVGKTALIEQLIFGNHVVGLDGMETLGDIYEAVIETESPAAEPVQIFDTPGNLFMLEMSNVGVSHYNQEHYLSIADGFVLVYDITSRSSFDLVVTIKHKITMKHRETPVVVIGNKFDLDGIRDVDGAVSTQWAKTNNVKLYETSVLDRESLKDPFTYITWCMANPGRPLPVVFQNTPFMHTSRRKSFTIHQTRKHSGQELLISSSSASAVIPASSSTTNSNSSSPETSRLTKHTNTDPFGGSRSSPNLAPSPLSTMRSTTSTTFSEVSVESRISTRLCPEDATYPKGGLFGLTDCMSAKNKSSI